MEILPKGAGKPSVADLDHLRDVAVTSGRPVFFLSFDANARPYVEKAAREGAQMFNLLRAIPFNPRFTLKKTTFFHNLDVWDVVMHLRVPERLAALADPERRAKMRDQALKPQRRRPGVAGPAPAPGAGFRPQGELPQEPGTAAPTPAPPPQEQHQHRPPLD